MKRLTTQTVLAALLSLGIMTSVTATAQNTADTANTKQQLKNPVKDRQEASQGRQSRKESLEHQAAEKGR